MLIHLTLESRKIKILINYISINVSINSKLFVIQFHAYISNRLLHIENNITINYMKR